MNRKRLIIALTLVLSLMVLPMSVQPPLSSPTSAPAEDVVGTGFWGALGCAACVAGVFAIASSGTVAVFIAVNAEGSFWVAAACVGLCVEALR